FDNAAETKPLLHLWSLGIEEQFYIGWPFLLWLAWKRKWIPFAATILITLISFGLNLSLTRSDNVTAFYSPHTRVWELLCGSLLAWIAFCANHRAYALNGRFADWIPWIHPQTPGSTKRKIISHALSGLGLLLLIYGFIRLDKNVTFPGVWATIPVLGTILMISAGADAWINRALLSHRIVVWFGLISFPLYLWHWPLLSFAHIIESEIPSRSIRISAVLLSVLLAWISYRFVEQPIRFGHRARFKTAVLVISMTFLGFIGILTYLQEGYPNRLSIRGYVNNKDELVRTPAVDSECLKYVNKVSPLFPYCRFTNAGSSETVAVVGDSHAHVAYPGIAEHLKSMGVNTVLLANSSCPPLLDVPILGHTDSDKRTCTKMISELLGVLEARRDIKKVFFFTRGPIYITGTEPLTNDADVMNGQAVSASKFEFGTQKTIDMLVGLGKQVLYVTENPELNKTPASCVLRPLRLTSHECAIDKASVLVRQKEYLNVVRRLSRADIVESIEVFCPNDSCRVFDEGGSLLYADDDHLSIAGSRFQAKHLFSRRLQ
ncbi:MAG: acyltransferase, partial [Bdellovibrionaceae bacterium]|nr:acyltransferase [Pseudobdellovibrionaceae bacterium]